jgi:thioredoxin-related protein
MVRLLLLILFMVSISMTAEGGKSKKVIIPKNKYALLIVESKSCIYCKQLDRDLRTDKRLQESLRGIDLFKVLYESYAPVVANFGGKKFKTSEKELVRRLRATSFPNLIFYDRNGNIILQIPGYLEPKHLRCVITYIKEESFKELSLKDYMKSDKCA